VPSSSASVGVRYRECGDERRDHRFELKLSAGERAVLAAAASRSGQTLAAYIVEAGLEKAEYRTAPVGAVHREMLARLMELADLAGSIGSSLSQTVTRTRSDGMPGPDPEPTAGYCLRVVRHIDEAAELIRRRLP
jgi:uncharacterized protein (DUF1778 family)